jgi:large subunit ribosomal protein L9
MKVILIKDVAKIGRRGEVVVVSDGFALNKLIPKGFAQLATAENMKKVAHISATLAQNKEIEANTFSSLLKSLEGKEVVVEVVASAEGTMFQALKSEVIAEAINKNDDGIIDASHVVLDHPIKTLGQHLVSLVSGHTRGEITISVIAKSK